MDPLEARKVLSAGGVLLDVREDEEWEAGHAPEATHVPLTELESRIEEVPRDKDVVVTCRSGARSSRVVSALEGAGFSLHNLDGGMKDWVASGLPVVRDDGGEGRIS